MEAYREVVRGTQSWLEPTRVACSLHTVETRRVTATKTVRRRDSGTRGTAGQRDTGKHAKDAQDTLLLLPNRETMG